MGEEKEEIESQLASGMIPLAKSYILLGLARRIMKSQTKQRNGDRASENNRGQSPESLTHERIGDSIKDSISDILALFYPIRE